MSDESKFWISVWAVLGSVLVVIVCCITGYHISENAIRTSAVKEMVLKGANPITAACSIHHLNDALCAAPDVLANRNK